MTMTNEVNKTFNKYETRELYLKPSKLFKNKNKLGRLTIRRRCLGGEWGRETLRLLKDSGVEMTNTENQLYQECFGNKINPKVKEVV